ncbi:MAG: protein translocase subunit SecD [Candidatus Pacebacteria bacterium]|nr:protein translocase subunit SecD [Candidatus Paceibacterota bacterium]
MNLKKRLRYKFAGVIVLAVVAGLIAYPKAVAKIPPVYNALNKLKINLGLDLQGGFRLEYNADLSQIDSAKRAEAMQSLQAAIERRVNAFGVSEPNVSIARSGSEEHLIVELAGVRNVEQAKSIIKSAPLLEFKTEKIDTPNQIPQTQLDAENKAAQAEADNVLQLAEKPGADFAALAKQYSQDPGSKDNGGDLGEVTKGEMVPEFDNALFDSNPKDWNGDIYGKVVESQFGWHIIKKISANGSGATEKIHAAHILLAKATQPQPQVSYVSTGLTGKNLQNAKVDFSGQDLGGVQIALQFDSQGAQLFDQITKNNIGKPLAIFLDGQMIEAPNIKTEIPNGQAVITGSFTLDQAKQVVQNLNEGALPVPITLVSQESVAATLGQTSLTTALKAGIIGLIIVLIFMIVYYRYLGLIASLGLLIYTVLMVSIFKLSPLTPWGVTFTLSGIAGLILSIGMAVDANVLIFERTKEELRAGRKLNSAVNEGFKRAWPSIRDGNFSTLLTSLILIWVGTGFVKGFAIILIIGVVVSMFTAIVLVKIILQFTLGAWAEKRMWLIARVKNSKEEKV